MLRADGNVLAKALQSCLDQEEGAAGGGANDARRGAAKHVDAKVLFRGVLEDDGGEGLPHGLVEAETAAVEQDLVDVGAADTTVDAPETLVAHNHGDGLDGPPVVVRLVALGLKLTLQLHSVQRI